MTVLLDANVLIASAFQSHTHYRAADDWLETLDGHFATCPITQGALLRAAFRAEYAAPDAVELLDQITGSDRHDFWPDALGFTEVDLAGVIGHRQVTDAYLAGLARARGGKVATFDRGFAALHTDVAELVPGP